MCWLVTHGLKFSDLHVKTFRLHLIHSAAPGSGLQRSLRMGRCRGFSMGHEWGKCLNLMHFSRSVATSAPSFPRAVNCFKYLCVSRKTRSPCGIPGSGKPVSFRGLCEAAWKLGCEVPFDPNPGHSSQLPGTFGNPPQISV